MSDVLKALAEIGKPKVRAIEIEGRTFHVRGMGSHQRAVFSVALQSALLENSTVPDHVVVALGLCQEDGSPVGTTEEVLAVINPLDGAVLNTLAKRILELSGFAKGAIEAAEKN